MAARVSAGILLNRRRCTAAEVFLVHPGGPFWANKDIGAWSVPKGMVDASEEQLACAHREFREETGFDADGQTRDLGSFRLPGGKLLHVWSIEGDCNPAELKSNAFEMEWPPKSGHVQSFPEVDRGGWFGRADALRKITKGQRPVIEAFFASIT